MKGFLLIFGALVALASAPPAAAQLVANGGFETGDFTGWTQVNDTSFSGVTCSSFGGTSPAGGNCQAFFGPDIRAGGGISQTISTIAGEEYSLSFQLANLGSLQNTFGLFWDGNFVSIDFEQNAYPYTNFTRSLMASGSSSSLAFIFYHETSFFLLDDISLAAVNGAVPEPGTWAMMLLGFGGMGLALRRRRKVESSISLA